MANLLTNEGSSGKLNPVPGAGSGVGLASKRNLSAKLAKWRTAALKAKELPDPWEGYDEWHFIKPLGKLECLLGITLMISRRRGSRDACTTLARGNGRLMR